MHGFCFSILCFQAAADRAERRANSTEKDGNNLEPVVRERNQSFISTSGIDNKIDKIRRRFSSVSRQSGSNRTTEQENSLDAASGKIGNFAATGYCITGLNSGAWVVCHV